MPLSWLLTGGDRVCSFEVLITQCHPSKAMGWRVRTHDEKLLKSRQPTVSPFSLSHVIFFK